MTVTATEAEAVTKAIAEDMLSVESSGYEALEGLVSTKAVSV